MNMWEMAMSDEKVVTMETAMQELQDAQATVTAAEQALTEAKAVESEKVKQIKKMMDELKEKAKELGLEMIASVEEAKQAVQEKLDEGKAEWAAEAATTPNAARRQVRLVWAVLGAVAGVLVGLGAGYVIWGIF